MLPITPLAPTRHRLDAPPSPGTCTQPQVATYKRTQFHPQLAQSTVETKSNRGAARWWTRDTAPLF